MRARLPYEHGFHAGNFADAMKHTCLLLLLQRMCDKSSGFVYVDTHAGAGRYDLGGGQAARLNESSDGIGLLQASVRSAGAALPPPIHKLVQLSAGRYYPGSPLIAAEGLRPQDSMLLCELAPEQHALLASTPPLPALVAAGQAQALCVDGYKALRSREKSVVTPQRRALVFVDPPYQMGGDTERTVQLVSHLARHWRAARVAVWYPMRDADKTARLYEQLGALELGGKAVLAAELTRAATPDGRLSGSGVVLIEPHCGTAKEGRRDGRPLVHLTRSHVAHGLLWPRLTPRVGPWTPEGCPGRVDAAGLPRRGRWARILRPRLAGLAYGTQALRHRRGA